MVGSIVDSIDLDRSYTYILQLEVGALTVGEFLILIQLDSCLESVEVCSIVGDVQLTVAIHHREVATAIQTTRMLRTDGDEVAVIHVIERCCRVTEDRRSIGIGLVTVRRYVTACKHSIMNNDTTFRVVGIRIAVGEFSTSEKLRPILG